MSAGPIIANGGEFLGVLLGAQGGDSGGSTPSSGEIVVPTTNALTVLDAVDMADIGTVLWHLQMQKVAAHYSCLVHANNDGATPNHIEAFIVQSPLAGTYDFTVNVDASGGNMRLTVTPATTGWTATLRQISALTL